MLPILQLGPLAIQFPGLILLAGLWLGIEITERNDKTFGLSGNKLSNLALLALVSGLLGGRIMYVILHPEFFASTPLNMFSLSPTLFNLPGALITAAIASLSYGRRNQMPFGSTLDALTGLLAIIMIALHLANFASGNAYGTATSLPWAVNLAGTSRHPVQIYEALAAVVILLLLLPSSRNPLNRIILAIPSMRFWSFIALSSLARLLLEAFRGDSDVVLGQFRLAQIAAWFVLAISLFFLYRFSSPPPAITDQTTQPD
jgi:prolipoprotein diacylglyceryltransferase